MSLFVIFKLPVTEADSNTLDAFLKETILNVEVAIIETPKQSDQETRREKFDGAVVYARAVSETSETIRKEVEGQWLIVWKVIVPISSQFHPSTLTFRTWSV